MAIKVFRLDDVEWWAGESLAACIEAARSLCGAGSFCDAEHEGRELTAQELSTLQFHDEDGTQRTFAEQLALEVAAGTKFPALFARRSGEAEP